MRFEILGPLAVRNDDAAGGEELVISRSKARTVLGVLLCEPGVPVATERLVDALWPDDPSRAAVRNLRVYVHQLRQVLGAERIEWTRHGYRLHVIDDELDAARFTAFTEQAATVHAQEGDDRRAAALLRSALDLWRGEPFGGCERSPVLSAQARRWEETRLGTVQRCLELELNCGRHRELVPELVGLVQRHPLAEGFRAQLMLALHRGGRTSEALEAFTEGRATIVAETGLEPGSTLADLQHAILRSDPALELPEPEGAHEPISTRVGVPTQLPADIGDFTGREKQIDQLCALLADDTVESPVVVSAIAGRGGVGKTTLAVHAAHRLAGAFDDGQLYVDLRGAEAAPLDPGEVLGRFLRALGVDGASIPDGVDERAGLYRSKLTGRRVLVVLDNAASEQQVRPLFPGGRACAVLVTSRARLGALAGASRLDLDALDPDQATELLARIAGRDRAAAEPDIAETIVRLCGCLPLALRIAGARLATHPEWSLARLARRLSDERHRLNELAVGDLEVRGSLELSYAGIPALARRAVRLLGAAELPEFAAWILCPLLEVERDTAEALVEVLEKAQLLDALGEDATGQLRYQIHDLVRVYARERAEADDPESERHAALRRLAGAWLALANRGADALRSGLPRPRPGVATRWELDPTLATALLNDPLAWFESEAPALLAAVDLTDRLDLDDTAWELFSALVAGRYMIGSQFDEWWRTYRVAHSVVVRADNTYGKAIVESGIGLMYFRQDNFSDAIYRFDRAVTVFERLGNNHEEAIAHCGIAISFASQGRTSDALRHARHARGVFDRSGDQHAIACSCEILGAVLSARGEHADALVALHRALDGYRACGDRRGEANTSTRIGRAHLGEGEHETAAEWLCEARGLFGQLSDRAGQAETAYALATTLVHLGEHQRAQAELRQCLAAYEELGRDSSAARVLGSLGEMALQRGKLDDSAEYLERAQHIWAEYDQPLWRARTLLTIGDLHAARGDLDQAHHTWRSAQTLFADLESPEIGDATARIENQTAP